MKTGIELIADERQRQVDVEGWSPEHDDKHRGGTLAVAGAAYALPASRRICKHGDTRLELWPWDMSWFKPAEGSVNGRVRELVKAGALIAAEIDRLQRAQAKQD